LEKLQEWAAAEIIPGIPPGFLV